MRLKTLFITLPVALVLVLLAIANRQSVTLSFDPLSSEPVFALQMPLFLALFASLLVGLLVGGLVAWASGFRRRRVLIRDKRDLARSLQQAQQVPDPTNLPAAR